MKLSGIFEIGTRRECPECRRMTLPLVVHPLLRLLTPWFDARWCPECHWEGMRWRPWRERSGRSGDPRFSGFNWSKRREDAALRFTWKGGMSKTKDPASTDHPSGFRWGGD